MADLPIAWGIFDGEQKFSGVSFAEQYQAQDWLNAWQSHPHAKPGYHIVALWNRRALPVSSPAPLLNVVRETELAEEVRTECAGVARDAEQHHLNTAKHYQATMPGLAPLAMERVTAARIIAEVIEKLDLGPFVTSRPTPTDGCVAWLLHSPRLNDWAVCLARVGPTKDRVELWYDEHYPADAPHSASPLFTRTAPQLVERRPISRHVSGRGHEQEGAERTPDSEAD